MRNPICFFTRKTFITFFGAAVALVRDYFYPWTAHIERLTRNRACAVGQAARDCNTHYDLVVWLRQAGSADLLGHQHRPVVGGEPLQGHAGPGLPVLLGAVR